MSQQNYNVTHNQYLHLLDEHLALKKLTKALQDQCWLLTADNRSLRQQVIQLQLRQANLIKYTKSVDYKNELYMQIERTLRATVQLYQNQVKQIIQSPVFKNPISTEQNNSAGQQFTGLTAKLKQYEQQIRNLRQANVTDELLMVQQILREAMQQQQETEEEINSIRNMIVNQNAI